MNLIIRVVVACTLLGVIAFFYHNHNNPPPPTAAQAEQARIEAARNPEFMSTTRYDGHLFIVLRGSEGPSGLVHHPGCACLQRIPDPSILEHVNGRQHLPNNGGILER